MIHHGDLFDVLPTLAAESVDACVTDPPYGIGFMGKEWDSFAPGNVKKEFDLRQRAVFKGDSTPKNIQGRKRTPAASPSQIQYDRSLAAQRGFQEWTARWAAEVLRVLKPGAYIVVCGAPRSHHRMMSGLEDAGFEIRDCFAFLFGSGFPKNLNVSDALKRSGFACTCGDPLRSVRQTTDDAARVVQEDEAAGLFAPLQRKDSRAESCGVLGEHEGPKAEGSTLRRRESVVEGRRDLLQNEGQLQEHPVPASAGLGATDGSQGRLHHGAPVGHGRMGRTPADADRSGSPRRSQPDEQSAHEPGTLADEQQPPDARGWARCDRCSKPMVPAGLGTALKPGHEPIAIARKPFNGTVAANVAKHGTGALNIDACRVAGESWEREASEGPRHLATDYRHKQVDQASNDLGRWPANVLLDEEAAALLDAQTGELISGAPSGIKAGGQGNAFGHYNGGIPVTGFGDAGGASRFYYVAKPSREERDMGCYDLQERPRDDGRKEGHPGGDNPRNRGLQPRGNCHPTVKPVELMRWLVKLVTPINGVVLDPFTGSGTTGMACAYEQRPFIGVEKEAEYIEIATRRIAAVAPLFSSEVSA